VEGIDGWGPQGNERGSANGRSTLTERVHRAAGREWARARGDPRRQAWPTGHREGEGERESVCADAGGR
jgi:hypothetical protein